MLLADLVVDRGPAPRRPMVAFAILAPWLTFDVRGWWTMVGSTWDSRVHSAHGFADRSDERLDHASAQGLDEIFRAGEIALALAVAAGVAWWLAKRIDWGRRSRLLSWAGGAGGALSVAMMAALAVHGRGLPTVDAYRAGLRSLPVAGTVFTFPYQGPRPPELEGRRTTVDLGEGVEAVRECYAGGGITLALAKPPRVSCIMPMPNLRAPVVIRRDAARDLWFFDDGADLLAYRGSDLRCIDLSMRYLLLRTQPSAAWLWGGALGLALALFAQVSVRVLSARARHAGPTGAERVARAVVTLRAFTVAVLFATMPPVASTLLLGALVQ
jgi:hypothetical protein